MPIRMIIPKLDRKLSANINIYTTSLAVMLDVIGITARRALDVNETVSQQTAFFSRECLHELNDIIVNEQTEVHERLLRDEIPKRWSKTSSVANLDAGWLIFFASFF